MSEQLPIAGREDLAAQARLLARRHRRGLLGTVALHATAAAAGLAAPLAARRARPVGRRRGRRGRTSTGSCSSSRASCSCRRSSPGSPGGLRSSWRRGSSRSSARTSCGACSRCRSRRSSAPGTGDLVSRTTADVDALARTIRFAVPETLIAAVTSVLTVAAAVWVSPLVALPCIAGVPALWIGTRWYLERAPQTYLAERAAYACSPARSARPSRAGARSRRSASARSACGGSTPISPRPTAWERRGLYLRTIWFPTAEFAYAHAGRGGARLGRLARLRAATRRSPR